MFVKDVFPCYVNTRKRSISKWKPHHEGFVEMTRKLLSAAMFVTKTPICWAVLSTWFYEFKRHINNIRVSKQGTNIQNVPANLWISSRVVIEKIIYIWLIYVKRHRQLVDFALNINFYLYYYYGKKYYCFLVQDR